MNYLFLDDPLPSNPIQTNILFAKYRGGQKSQIFLATSFSELVFTAEYENRGEIG